MQKSFLFWKFVFILFGKNEEIHFCSTALVKTNAKLL